MNSFCPKCLDLKEVDLKEKAEVFIIRKDQIDISAKFLTCKECGQEFNTSEIEEENFKLAYSKYRDKHDLLQPDEMKAIRNKYGLSQRAFARLLGWSETIISQYEKGRLQDSAHNGVYVSLKNARMMKWYFDRNEDKLSNSERGELEYHLRELIKEEDEKLWYSIYCEFPIDEFSGQRKFDFSKLSNMILYILNSLNGVYKTKLLKLLFYSDFLHYKHYGVALSGARYVHLPYGPVPNEYDHYLNRLKDHGKIKSEFIPQPNGEYADEHYSLIHADMGSFTQNEIKVLDFVIEQFKYKNSTEMKELSHKESAYELTDFQDIISYKFADKLSISLPS